MSIFIAQRWRSLVGAAVFATCSSPLTAGVVLDFESYQGAGNTTVNFMRGEELTTQYDEFGITFVAKKKSGNTFVDGELWIFDTDPSQVTAGATPGNDGDSDLVTPSDKSAPGNTTPLGKVIIVQEDTSPGSIPDDNVDSLITVFFDQPRVVRRLGILDIEETGTTLVGYSDLAGNNQVSSTPVPALGDNSYQIIDVPQVPVVRFDIVLPASGAIAVFDFRPIPEPATIVWLLMGGLAGLFALRRLRGKSRPAPQA